MAFRLVKFWEKENLDKSFLQGKLFTYFKTSLNWFYCSYKENRKVKS